MQATVTSYDGSGAGVVLDDGRRFEVGPAALVGSGIRLLRPGQRVQVQLVGEVVVQLRLPHP